MADLKSLIKLRRHNVEEKQKVLADLYRKSEEIEGEKQELSERLQRERQALDKAENIETVAYFGRFSEVVRHNIDRLNGELARLETRIRIAQDDMREAFANLKRVEIVQRNREQAEEKEQNDKENNELDEIGIESFRRKDEEF